jgi:hypothetical protein
MRSSSPGRTLGTILWILSFLLMLGAGVYQRLTGPTHPMRVAVEVGDQERTMRLVRAAWTDEKARIEIPALDGVEGGTVSWRRYPTEDAWAEEALIQEDEQWVARLPIQPAAGKLEYWVDLSVDGRRQRLPEEGDGQAVLRYRDPVPLGVLIPHIAFMFFGVLIAWRAGLGAIAQPLGLGRLAWWAFGLFTIGGMILGPIVQKYAFGEYWTGVPFGWDLTDNKTLVMWLAWLIAGLVLPKLRPEASSASGGIERAGPAARGLVLLASIVTVFVYLIPHSVQGSELDYDAIERGVPAEEAIGIG